LGEKTTTKIWEIPFQPIKAWHGGVHLHHSYTGGMNRIKSKTLSQKYPTYTQKKGLVQWLKW
jgi:hypothetical protein